MVWTNFDIATKSLTIHQNAGCKHVFERSETPLKGLDELKRDGGWIQFEKYLQAHEFCTENFMDSRLVQCC